MHLNWDAILNLVHDDDNKEDEEWFSASENSIHSPDGPFAEMQLVKLTGSLSFDGFDEDAPEAKHRKIDH